PPTLHPLSLHDALPICADESLQVLIEDNRLHELRGIGSRIAEQIKEIYEHGTFDLYEDLLSAIPPGLGELLRVKGLGAKKVRRLDRKSTRLNSSHVKIS